MDGLTVDSALSKALGTLGAMPVGQIAGGRKIDHEAFDELWGAAGCPERHRGFKVSTARGQEWREAYGACGGKLFGRGTLLALVGGRGSGKTQMAVEFIRMACKTGMRARYARTVEFFMDVRATYREGEKRSEVDIVNEYARPRLLVLDEAHERADTAWTGSLLNLLIDRRYAACKDTVLIANMSKDAFLASVGPSIASRMSEIGGVVECNWASFR